MANMHIEGTPARDRDFQEKISTIPCHARADQFDGLCYMPTGHDGDHYYQPRLDLYK